MAPHVSHSSFNTGYPIFAADFDPYNRGYLLVGGGGGENRNGIANRIDLLDVSAHKNIDHIATIDLSTKEDSVQSLASVATQDGLVTYAGISSSRSDIAAGKNEHFRSFEIEYPPRKRARTDAGPSTDKEKRNGGSDEAAIIAQGRAALFTAPTRDRRDFPYQKLLRLSPVDQRETPTKRVGAVSSATAEQNEIVIFEATTSYPHKTSICKRIVPEDGSEAVDMDIASGTKEGAFELAFCTDHAAFIYGFKYDFSSRKLSSPFDTPSRILTSKSRLRSIRWLGPKHLLILLNNPIGQQGAEIMTLYIDDPTDAAIATNHTRLPRSIHSGIGLDTTNLDADAATDQRQIIAAVAGKDSSIRIYTLDYNPSYPDPHRQVSSPRLFHTFRDVHTVGTSKVLLSSFFPPVQPSNSPRSVASGTTHVQLASTSLNGGVAVDWLALTSVPTSPAHTSDVTGKRKTPSVRWVLSSPWTELLRAQWVRGILAIAFAVTAILLQYRLFGAGGRGIARRGASETLTPIGPLDDYPDAAADVPPASLVNLPHEVKTSLTESQPSPWPDVASSEDAVDDEAPNETGPGEAEETITETYTETLTSTSTQVATRPTGPAESLGHSSSLAGTAHRLQDILHNHHRHQHNGASSAPHEQIQRPILVYPESDADGFDGSGVGVSLHEAGTLTGKHGARRYEDLRVEEKEKWHRRLEKAGRWTKEEGESVLKSVLFSEYAAVVGGAIRDAVLER